MSEGAFLRVFKAEMEEAQHWALIELYEWANRKDFAPNPDLRARAEKWAADIEDAGLAMAVLEATAEP